MAPKRILIVEDHHLFADALEHILGRRLAEADRGAGFRRATTVAGGIEIADQEGPFDVAIVDLVLPDGDGAELVREIKAAYPGTGVVVLSAVGNLSGAIDAGADEAISKGVPLLEIVDRLEALTVGNAATT